MDVFKTLNVFVDVRDAAEPFAPLGAPSAFESGAPSPAPKGPS